MGKGASILTDMEGLPNFNNDKPINNKTPLKVQNLLEDPLIAPVSFNVLEGLNKNGLVFLHPSKGLFSHMSGKVHLSGYTRSKLSYYPDGSNKTDSNDSFGSDFSDCSTKASILSPKPDINRRIRPLSPPRYSSIPHRGQSEDLIAKEARTNRKIMDLEISNNSLLSINASLEAKIKKQADQIEQLKKKIASHSKAESSLMVYGASATNRKDTSTENEEIFDPFNDQGFTRVCSMLDTLISDAKKSLEYKKQTNGGKVLTISQFEKIPRKAPGELCDMTTRSLSDISEEHESCNNSKEPTLENSRKKETITYLAESPDFSNVCIKPEIENQRINELINQIWDLTDKTSCISSEVPIQKEPCSLLHPPSSNSKDIMFSVLTQLKESSRCGEMNKNLHISHSHSGPRSSQFPNISGKPLTVNSLSAPRLSPTDAVYSYNLKSVGYSNNTSITALRFEPFS